MLCSPQYCNVRYFHQTIIVNCRIELRFKSFQVIHRQHCLVSLQQPSLLLLVFLALLYFIVLSYNTTRLIIPHCTPVGKAEAYSNEQFSKSVCPYVCNNFAVLQRGIRAVQAPLLLFTLCKCYFQLVLHGTSCPLLNVCLLVYCVCKANQIMFLPVLVVFASVPLSDGCLVCQQVDEFL